MTAFFFFKRLTMVKIAIFNAHTFSAFGSRFQELSKTLKSRISLGRWNGLRVVIKANLQGEEDFTEELLHEIELLGAGNSMIFFK